MGRLFSRSRVKAVVIAVIGTFFSFFPACLLAGFPAGDPLVSSIRPIVWHLLGAANFGLLLLFCKAAKYAWNEPEEVRVESKVVPFRAYQPQIE